jgi:hypothetical protein
VLPRAGGLPGFAHGETDSSIYRSYSDSRIHHLTLKSRARNAPWLWYNNAEKGFMAKPRVFVSSTYYDLKHIRASLELFIESLGFEAIFPRKVISLILLIFP